MSSLDRIHATCICKKVVLKDSHIIHPTGKIKITLNKKITFTHIEGDQLYSEQLIRDIAVLALDQPYYPVTIEEWDGV